MQKAKTETQNEMDNDGKKPDQRLPTDPKGKTSISDDPSFLVVPRQPEIIMNPRALPTEKPGEVLRITLRPKIWCNWKLQKTLLHLTYTETGYPFPIAIQNAVGRNHDHIILRDHKGNACALLIKKSVHRPQVYKMYCFQPHIQGQKPSKTHDYGHLPPMYKWATIVSETEGKLDDECDVGTARAPVFTMTLADGTIYHSNLAGRTLYGLQQRYHVTRKSQGDNGGKAMIVAHMEQAFHPVEFSLQKSHPWSVTIGPANDPGVVIALIAVMNDLIVQ